MLLKLRTSDAAVMVPVAPPSSLGTLKREDWTTIYVPVRWYIFMMHSRAPLPFWQLFNARSGTILSDRICFAMLLR